MPTAFADVQTAHVFSSGAILQQQQSVRIWDTADPGEKVAVRFAEQLKTIGADGIEKWRKMPASPFRTDVISMASEGRHYLDTLK